MFIQGELSGAGIDDVVIESRVMVRAVIGENPEIMLNPDAVLTDGQWRQIKDWTARRAGREPLQYITGRTEFYGREFRVNEHVLAPRPETELIVEQAVAFARRRPPEHPLIADIGSGSGVIAVSLACELPQARVIATDISPEALAVTGANAERNGVSGRIDLRSGDLLGPLRERCDIIVSNPPYVLSGYLDGPEAQPELSFEPRMALDGGADGMDVLRPLIAGLPRVLAKGSGAAYLEIDPPVAEACLRLAKRVFGASAQVFVLTDLAGLERCLAIEPG